MGIIRALRDWRCYIYGSPFTTIVWTDHHNLKYYTHPQKLTRQQVRWVVELMEYDLKLQHKKGSKMVVADALSQRADWSTGLEHDNEDVVALPESLWVRLVDTELQDTVAAGQQEDNLVRDTVAKLSDSHNVGPLKPLNKTLPPVYCSIMDTSTSQTVSTCDVELSWTIMILQWQGIRDPWRPLRVCVLPIGGLEWLPLLPNTFKAVLHASNSKCKHTLNEPPLWPSWYRLHDGSPSLGRF